ncbi:glycosyltransferase family 1 protein [Xenorhabdus sp. PB30.3]|uniref:glycosyltransferase family 4 protein n=1 Tax=Xenorhabdus sp. PB30.3 TaxID=2788941 RepID=UPI001E47940D|nr:glycosyltransferase family 1 protein [Xenorhabdus sp. PB30.3]MCC8381949.1 glycosyltransferase family 4 protein [Xenorhabdus sp. PB30.3]
MSIIIGIDASRNRSGGAKAHLIGILSSINPKDFGIDIIHIWSFRGLLDELPDKPWLVKHNPPELESSLPIQLSWQALKLKKEVKNARCDILFTTDASTVCRFSPMVVMSQDMLSYEPGIMDYFGYGYERVRLLAILYLQNLAFRHASGVIFLTNYAAKVIQSSCGKLPNVSKIPHGVGSNFQSIIPENIWPYSCEQPIRAIYISNTDMYKHQWNVVKAIKILRDNGFNIQLRLVGGGHGKAQARLEEQIQLSDPERFFVRQDEFVPQHTLPKLLAQSDLFIFASSCENMPVTLIEAMASGLPIACSNRGPMPEILEDGGVYFNPEKPSSIANAIEDLIVNPKKRETYAKRAKELSQQYSWERCAKETFQFIEKIAKKNRKKISSF